MKFFREKQIKEAFLYIQNLIYAWKKAQKGIKYFSFFVVMCQKKDFIRKNSKKTIDSRARR